MCGTWAGTDNATMMYVAPIQPHIVDENEFPGFQFVIKGTFVAHEYRPLASVGLEPWKTALLSLSAS